MRTRMIVLVGFCALALGLIPAFAQDMMKIAGKMEATYVKHEPIEVGDTEEHMMILGRSEGTNTSTGEHMFMDGAQLVDISFADVVKGNGPHEGYIKMAMGEDAVDAKWQGMVTTVMSDDGTPMMSFEGTFIYTGGMGKYMGIKGSGTYKGHFTSETDYVTEWEGEYAIMEE